MRVALILAALCVASCFAANSTVLKVGVFPATPLITITNTSTGVTIDGFSYELWNAIAAANDFEFEYVTFTGIALTLNATMQGEIDLAICDIGITSTREASMDFSQPFLYTGLGIMVYADEVGTRKQSKTDTVMKSLFPRLFWECFGVLVLSILVFANLFYIIERKPKGMEAAVRPSYRRGGFEDSLWWASGVLFTGGGPLSPTTSVGRFLTFLATIFSTILIAIIGSTITAALTVSSLQTGSSIADVNDLAGLRVGVVSGSTSESFLKTFNIELQGYSSAAALLVAFTARQDSLNAAFDDSTILEYYVKTTGKGLGVLVGPSYQPVGYGIAYPQGSSLVKTVDKTILQMQQDGDLADLEDKYFSYTNPDTAQNNILDPDGTSLGVTWGLVAAFGLFVIGVLSFRCFEDRKKAKRAPTDPASTTKDDVDTLQTEIEELSDALQEFAMKLDNLRKNAQKLQASKGKTFSLAP